MGRGDPIYPSKAARLAARSASAVPPGLRGRLESTRLDLLALFRALDRMRLAQDFPDELRALGELDADCAEALHVMDLPPGRLDLAAMVRDTMASLALLPAAREEFLTCFDGPTREKLQQRAAATRALLQPDEAYLGIPGRAPIA
jgi:hypothetical protein